jgi:hypothetical protein
MASVRSEVDKEKMPNSDEIWRGKLGKKEIQLRVKSMQCMTLYRLTKAQGILQSRNCVATPIPNMFVVYCACRKAPPVVDLLGKGADDFGGDVEEEYGRDERE